MTMHKTVITLPESSGNLLCLHFTGIVTLENHAVLCDKPLRAIVSKYGNYRFLALYKDFAGWTTEAADNNFRLINDICHAAERLAYVNPPERKMLQLSLQRAALTPDMSFFDEGDLEEALAWIQQRP